MSEEKREAREWSVPPRARARVQAVLDAANREVGGILSGVKDTLDVPEDALFDMQGWRFFTGPPPAGVNGQTPTPPAAPPTNRAERRRQLAEARKAAKAEPPEAGE